MRVSILFLLFCSVWLYGGEHPSIYNAGHSHGLFLICQNEEIAKQIGLTSSAENDKIFDDSDLEISEEIQVLDTFAPNLFKLSNKFFNNNPLEISKLRISKDSQKRLKIFPSFFDYSQPIYISQRVLRI